MSKTYIGYGVRSLDTEPLMSAYSKVVLNVSDTLWYESGDDTGRTLTLDNPWGTQEMCDRLLENMLGYQHQPLSVTGAQIDPAAELWDGITVGDVYGGIGSIRTRFGTMLTADIESPGEQAVDHEFPYTPKSERKIERQFMDVRASLQVNADAIIAEVAAREADAKEIRATLEVQAGEISAKVSKEGGSESFGWSMNEIEQVWTANGLEIFRLDKSGASVYGEIRATSGTIGGFTIGQNDLRYNNQDWEGTNATGVYIGQSGIQLGSKSNGFRVDSAGNLHAYSGSFRGSVSAGNIDYGGGYGTLNGSGISSYSIGDSRIIGNSLTSGSMVPAIGTSLANANSAYNVCTGTTTTSLIKANSIVFDKHTLGRSTVTINGVATQIVTWL